MASAAGTRSEEHRVEFRPGRSVGGVIEKVGREGYWREQVGAWRGELERAERAGLAPVTVREFCRSRGLREPCFYLWRRELSRHDGNRATRRKSKLVEKPAGALFAPVTVRPEPAKAPEIAPIELEVGGVTLRVPSNFDEATLARLIAVLQAHRHDSGQA